MSNIHLTTFIAAPIERVFDLSRSISLHKISMQDSKEDAIAGRTSGLIKLNETVTWQGEHLYKKRRHVSKITAMDIPEYFVDEMISGDFKSFKHEHYFKETKNGTIMIDKIEFESPYRILGRLVNRFYLKNYLESLIKKRNDIIKAYAETEKWKMILN